MASSTDPGTWCSFAGAVASVGKWGTAGIGFVFGGDRAYTGLDLDHVLHDGVLEEQYRWVVEAADTYTEVSPSGDGLHLYFRGSKPEGATRCRKGPVEMYDHERFFTVTGVPFGAVRGLASRPDVVEKAYRMWIEPEQGGSQPTLADAATTPPSGGVSGNGGGAASDAVALADFSDDELVERMLGSRNGAEIRALLDGDLSAHGGDHSAADMALCNHLAFWFGGDEVRMDRIFRGSGLMRDKWDQRRGGSTYGAQTLANAAGNAREHYKPRRRNGMRAGQRGTSRRGSSRGGAGNTDKCSIQSASPAASPSLQPRPETRFDPDNPPSVGPWVVDRRGRLWHSDGEGKTSYEVTSTPPWVAAYVHDVDSGAGRVLARVRVRGVTHEEALDHDALFCASKIDHILGKFNANIDSSNAKEVVAYLSFAERRLGDVTPVAASCSHTGFAGAPLAPFMPYDETDELRFMPQADLEPKARRLNMVAGDLAGWVAAMAGPRAESMAFRTVLAASFASPLLSVCELQAFVVYIWGRSRSGKTPTLKAAGSVWGDPTEGPDSYYRTFMDTPKSTLRTATLMHDVPMIIDELQAKNVGGGGQAARRASVESLLYQLTLGREQDALYSDRTSMRSGYWKTIVIATGEIPILGDSTMQGAANRTMELNVRPFSSEEAAGEMHRAVARQHGTAGRAYVAGLRENEKAFFDQNLEIMASRAKRAFPRHPQAVNAALLGFADALAEYYVFSGRSRGWDECFEGGWKVCAWALGHATGGEGADTDVKAIARVVEMFAENSMHFETGCEMDRLTRWGWSAESHAPGGGTMWYVYSSVLEEDLTAHGFDKGKTLRRMADEGLIADMPAEGRGFGKQRRLPGTSLRPYAICVDGAAVDRFLARAWGEDVEAPVGDVAGVAPAVVGGGDAAGGVAVAGGGGGAVAAGTGGVAAVAEAEVAEPVQGVLDVCSVLGGGCHV